MRPRTQAIAGGWCFRGADCVTDLPATHPVALLLLCQTCLELSSFLRKRLPGAFLRSSGNIR